MGGSADSTFGGGGRDRHGRGRVFYALQATISGVAAGEDRWYLFATVGGLESAGRLLLMLLRWPYSFLPWRALRWATVISDGSGLILALETFSGRRQGVARADVPAGRLTVNILVVPVLGRRAC